MDTEIHGHRTPRNASLERGCRVDAASFSGVLLVWQLVAEDRKTCVRLLQSCVDDHEVRTQWNQRRVVSRQEVQLRTCSEKYRLVASRVP